MPIQENALNAAIAEALSTIPDENLSAIPEKTQQETGAERCDALLYRETTKPYYAALECKIGQELPQRQAAVQDAQRWLKHGNCWNAIALCYPKDLSEDAPETPLARLKVATDLLMVRVDKTGPTGRWRRGSIRDLARLADEIDAQAYAITKTLREAILVASGSVDQSTGKKLAAALELPWEPQKGKNDPRPARIACLLIANMALLQNRMHSGHVDIPGLQRLGAVQKAITAQRFLEANWMRIRAVDYAPVVDPALTALDILPENHATESLFGTLLEAVFKCVKYIRGFRLDHAGPMYHDLLQTARYDGSFYTSTPAAMLLAELAMPPTWDALPNGWKDANQLAKLKICDPACGTGTLLMATARTIEARFRHSGGNQEDASLLHLSLVSDVLYGLDINLHAIHLAASMLTLSAPKIDYNRMRLYNMRHGINAKNEARAGSLDLLAGSAEYLPGISPQNAERRLTAEEYKEDPPQLEGACDLVIMNPPFTRNDIRNRQLAPELRRRVQQHEIEIAAKTTDPAHRKAIDQTAAGTFFAPIADRLLKPEWGTLALVRAFTVCTAASGKYERALLTDPQRFHLELVITSHDNRRIAFSGNTNIHECLIIAHRPSEKTKGKPTAFVSLAENPNSVSEGYFLAQDIRKALDGDKTNLASYGSLVWRTPEQLRQRPWTAAAFYHQALAEDYDELLTNAALAPIGSVAAVEPAGRRIHDAFTQAKYKQNPDIRALWRHRSERQTAMRTGPDRFLVPKKDMNEYGKHLWNKSSHLLLANRMRLNVVRTPAVFSDEPILGSAFVPVTPRSVNGSAAEEKLAWCKAWCVWLNSTAGILAYLNIRQKQLTYPSFSLDGLRSLPVPHPQHCDLEALARAFDTLAEQTLLPLPEILTDQTRHALDKAVLAAVPGLDDGKVLAWRKAIAEEPSVNNQKGPSTLE